MKIFKRILIVLAVLIVGFLAIVAMQPDDYRIARSATMAAPPATVFEHVNDLHKWNAWSPWAKLDPKATNTFEGPPSGTGAVFKWSGNNEVGEGSMKITESRPNELIRIKLEFIKPFQGTADTEFAFKPEGDKTSVSWTMTGNRNFMGKAICLFMNMDRMIGDKYEQGLASLKKEAEADPQKNAGAPPKANDAPAKTDATPAKPEATSPKGETAPAKSDTPKADKETPKADAAPAEPATPPQKVEEAPKK